MAILAVSALAGAGIKYQLVKASNTVPEKTTVVSTEKAIPTQSSISPFVLEDTAANLDSVSKEEIARDSVETEVGRIPAVILENGIQDDS